MVQAVSAHSTFRGSREQREVFYKIPPDDWEHVDTANNVWVTGDLVYSRRNYGTADRVTIRHFNVRFEPQGVYAIIGTNLTKATAKQAPTDRQPDLEQKGPRVSDAHLQAWFEFYKKVHSDAEDTEDRALASARTNFPGKAVSRERVRELRGSRRRGPKKKSE